MRIRVWDILCEWFFHSIEETAVAMLQMLQTFLVIKVSRETSVEKDGGCTLNHNIK